MVLKLDFFERLLLFVHVAVYWYRVFAETPIVLDNALEALCTERRSPLSQSCAFVLLKMQPGCHFQILCCTLHIFQIFYREARKIGVTLTGYNDGYK